MFGFCRSFLLHFFVQTQRNIRHDRVMICQFFRDDGVIHKPKLWGDVDPVDASFFREQVCVQVRVVLLLGSQLELLG